MKQLTTGLMSALMACSGGAILIIQAVHTAGLSHVQMMSWFGSVYIGGGLLNLFLTLKYKIPFAGAHSITAIAFISTIAAQFSFAEHAGGFVLSGAILFLAGCTAFSTKS
ncbi:benzoate/H(+) symporter BenE family transporter [Paenibacillus sp. CC-CFT747]|nr:benzoate/H(+) symporter BenE family transporter [Paenibacillus sp. CC-CFT747]